MFKAAILTGSSSVPTRDASRPGSGAPSSAFPTGNPSLHGDLWDTWSGFYQPTLVKEPGYQEREQPKDIEECTRALWKLARWIGRGRESRDDPSDFTSDQIGRMLVATLRSLGQSQEVARILDK